MPDSAPAEVRYCSRCAAAMQTVTLDKPRRRCPACGFVHFTDPKVGVGVLVLGAGRLLLVRRAMDPERGRWSVPGGFLDAGEDPRVCAAREVEEETGLRVDVGDLLDAYFNPGPGGASLFLLYDGAPAGGTLRAGDDAEAVGYFGAGELPDLAFASTRDAVRRWLNPGTGTGGHPPHPP